MQEIKLNLLPLEYRVRKGDLTWVGSRRVVWPLVFLFASVMSSISYWIVLNDEVTTLKEIETSQISTIKKLAPVKLKVQNLKKSLNKIRKKNKALEGIQFSKTRWINIFQDLSSIVPSSTWFKSVNQKGEASVSIKASTLQFADIAQFMVDLEKQHAFVSVKLLGIKNIQFESKQAFSFDLSVGVNPELGAKSKSSTNKSKSKVKGRK
jgi:type IV pilus assembly protein PilN